MAVELKQEGGLAVLTLNRPEALNALSFSILGDIGRALDEVAEMKDIRALLVTGAGDKAFCAGADIKELRGRSLMDGDKFSTVVDGPKARGGTGTIHFCQT